MKFRYLLAALSLALAGTTVANAQFMRFNLYSSSENAPLAGFDPIVITAPPTFFAGRAPVAASIDVTVTGGDGNYSISGAPDFIYDQATAKLNGTVTAPTTLSLVATDGQPDSSDPAIVDISVYPPLTASILSAPASVLIGDPVTITPQAMGVVGTLSWQHDGSHGLQLDGASGVLTGTASTVGAMSIDGLIATDSADGATAPVAPFIINVGYQPVSLTAPPTFFAGRAPAPVSIDVAVTGGDGNYSISGAPGFVYDQATAKLNGTVTAPTTLTIVAADGQPVSSDPAEIVVSVHPTLTASIASAPATVVRGQSFTITPQASGVVGSLSWQHDGSNGLSLNSSTGVLTGTATTIGTMTVGGLVATDSVDGATAPVAPFQIEVTPNTVPAAFSFTNVANAMPSAVTISNAVTVSGFDGTVTASTTNGHISVAGGAWVTSAPIVSGQQLRARLTAPSALNTTATANITVGTGAPAQWSVNTNEVVATISAGGRNLTASTLFGADWTRAVPKRLIVASGVVIDSASNTAALRTGTGLAGMLTVENRGSLLGLAGVANGGSGGDAFLAEVQVALVNSGNLRSGGGGGGKGANGTAGSTTTTTTQGPVYPTSSTMWRQSGMGLDEVYWNGVRVNTLSNTFGATSITGNDGATYTRGANTYTSWSYSDFYVTRTGPTTVATTGGTGGDGGRGQGSNASAAAGAAGTAGGGGTATAGATGGTGGTWGQPGARGGNSGQLGGAAGAAIRGTALVSLTNTGSILGPSL